MQQPREERRMKREKKRYFLTKMIKKVPKGHLFSSLFTFLSSLKGSVANICNTPTPLINEGGKIRSTINSMKEFSICVKAEF